MTPRDHVRNCLSVNLFIDFYLFYFYLSILRCSLRQESFPTAKFCAFFIMFKLLHSFYSSNFKAFFPVLSQPFQLKDTVTSRDIAMFQNCYLSMVSLCCSFPCYCAYSGAKQQRANERVYNIHGLGVLSRIRIYEHFMCIILVTNCVFPLLQQISSTLQEHWFPDEVYESNINTNYYIIVCNTTARRMIFSMLYSTTQIKRLIEKIIIFSKIILLVYLIIFEEYFDIL